MPNQNTTHVSVLVDAIDDPKIKTDQLCVLADCHLPTNEIVDGIYILVDHFGVKTINTIVDGLYALVDGGSCNSNVVTDGLYVLADIVFVSDSNKVILPVSQLKVNTGLSKKHRIEFPFKLLDWLNREHE